MVKNKVNPIEEFFKSFSSTDEEIDFKFGDEVFSEKLDVISTSSLILDDALSSGGLPLGRLIQYYGGAGCGKTFLSFLAMKEAQKRDPNAYQFFIDAEQSYNGKWAHQLGLNLKRIMVLQRDSATYGQQLFERLLGIPKEDKKHKFVGKSKPGLLDHIAVGNMNINMIVLDSVGAIIPPGIDTAAVGQVTMGKKSKFFSEVLPKLAVEVKKANIPFIMINHLRAGMDPYGPDHTFAGGNAYNHALSANVYLEAVQRKDSNIYDENENKIGGTIRAVVEKSKFGPWPRKCEFKVNYTTGVVNLHEEIAELAIKYNIVNRPNNVMYEYGDLKWKGRAAFDSAILSDNKFKSDLINKIEEARNCERSCQVKVQEEDNKNLKNLPVDNDLISDVLMADQLEEESVKMVESE